MAACLLAMATLYILEFQRNVSQDREKGDGDGPYNNITETTVDEDTSYTSTTTYQTYTTRRPRTITTRRSKTKIAKSSTMSPDRPHRPEVIGQPLHCLGNNIA